jgi:mono/diheme cytochrome c family protein
MKTKWMIRLLPALAIALPLNADDATAGLWNKHCAKCHAKDGSASSPIGKKLAIKDYTDPASLAELTDEELFTMTKEGVKGTKMPGFAKKLSDEEIHALVAYMRAMAKS